MTLLFFVAMKNQLLLFLLFFTVISFSQEKRKIIHGKIRFDKTPVSDVNILNLSSNQGTTTNDSGWFEIPVSIGDSLQISHIKLQGKHIIITKEIFVKRNLKIELEENTVALEGFVLEKPKSIFYVDPEMMPPPIVNASTLHLPYADTKAKKDNAIIKFRSGATVNLDNLFNSINGNKRRKKQLEKISLEDDVLAKIRKHFTDDFFITDLQIKKENINPFLNYCYKKNIISYFKRNENIVVTKILMDESKTFPQKVNADSLLALKK